jgi:hypothetical protein
MNIEKHQNDIKLRKTLISIWCRFIPPPHLNLEVEKLYHTDSTLDTENFLHSTLLGMLTEGITSCIFCSKSCNNSAPLVSPLTCRSDVIQKSRTVVICEWGNMSEERNTWLHNHCLTSWEKFYTATASHSISEWPSINEASSKLLCIPCHGRFHNVSETLLKGKNHISFREFQNLRKEKLNALPYSHLVNKAAMSIYGRSCAVCPCIFCVPCVPAHNICTWTVIHWATGRTWQADYRRPMYPNMWFYKPVL